MQRKLLHGILNRNVKRSIGIRAAESLSWVHTSLPHPLPPDTTTTTTGSTSHKKEELDFWKAADILFSEAPKQKKKFGWDFHLWQLFVACLPSVAIYFTAQYARREMRRMEKEREQENAEKMKIQAKERDQEYQLLPGFQALEVRLGAIEKKINEIEVTKEKMIALVVKDGEQFKDGKIVEKNIMEQKTVAVEDMKALIDQKVKKAANDTEKVNEESKQIAGLKNNADASNATTKKEIKDK